MEIKYRAVDGAGAEVSGQLTADSESQAIDLLSERGLVPLSVGMVRERSVRRASSRAATSAQRALAIREVATLLTSGVGLVEAIENLAHAHRNDSIGAAFSELKGRLLAGESFSSSLAALPVEFPDYVYVLARTGELTGKLGSSLHDAADQMDYDEQTRQEARNALVYPVILIATGIGAVMLIFAVVVPRFAGMLKNPKADLPTISVWVLQGGVFFREHMLPIFAALVVLGVLLARALKQRDSRNRMLNLAASLPFLGPWVESMTVARWSSILAVLVENRVPIIDALEQARASSVLTNFSHRLDLAQRDVKAGKRLADALELHRVVDPTGVSMVRVGERSGELGRMLKGVASYWTGVNRNRMKRLLALIEPVTILIIGAAIGIIMVGIMLAIASLSNLTI
ncbi:type II secretion system F family protein [Niveibacterium sp.]|uniref:type II secretion system F family protein n=1 Tax=Niveibacterium sp. TaxID=2017444 RepID=UPI0035B48642